MRVVIRILGLANGRHCLEAGLYLKSFDADAFQGRGHVRATLDINQAKKFRDKEEAFEFWKTQSKVKPLDFRMKPNRPLTAFTVELEDYYETRR